MANDISKERSGLTLAYYINTKVKCDQN